MIHNLGEAFDDRNMFLQVALGMIALSQRFGDLVTRSTADLPPIDDHPVLDFTLGLLFFCQRVMAHARTAAGAPLPSEDRAESDAPVRPAGINVRDLLR